MTKKFSSTVAGASLVITAAGLTSRGLGFLREIIFADFFGLSAAYDVYLVSSVLPVTINTVVTYLGQNFFIPTYNKIKTTSGEEAENFTGISFWFFAIAGLALYAILFLFSGSIIGLYLHNSSADIITVAVNVFRIFIITIPVNAAVSVLSAYMQSEFEYKTPAYSQLFLNTAVIILVLLYSGNNGIYSIPAGYLCGTFLQLFYLVFKTGKVLNSRVLKISFNQKYFNIISISFILTLVIESISQVYLIADRFLFQQVDKGGIAALNYALNIFVLPVSIISAALSTALFPKFSKSYSVQSEAELERSMNNFFSFNIFIFVPLTFVFLFYGDSFIRLMFQRGAFTPGDTIMTFRVLKIYSLSLIFYSAYVVLNKLLYSAELVKQLLYITISGCLIKVALNFILVTPMQQEGLALSSSLSYFSFFMLSLVIIYKKLKITHKNLFINELIICTANAIFCWLIVFITKEAGIHSDNIAINIIYVAEFACIYIINAVILNQKGTSLFTEMLKNLRSLNFNNF